MKKMLLLFSGLTLCAINYAQVPVNRTMSMVEKSTASWCVPCGSSAWTLQEQLITDNMVGAMPNAIVMETHGDYSAFHTETAMTLIQDWMGTSLPRWAVNNLFGQNESGNTRYDIKKKVDSFALLAPTASAGFYYSLSGNTIKFYTKTQFWKAANGTYAVASYIVEDSAYGEQQGQPGANAYHRYVLRANISKNVFGDTIAIGSIAAGQTYSKSYIYTITRTDWVKSHLSFVTAIFKKTSSNTSGWEVVNVNSIASKSTGVANISAVDQLLVFPNPAADRVHISGALNVVGDARISIVNTLGQTVFEKFLPWHNNQLAEDIELSGLSNGVYALLICTGGTQATMQRLIVTR